MEKRKISEEMIILLRQLVMNGHISMATEVLKVYFIREFGQSEESAQYLMKRYFLKYYGDHVNRFRYRIAKQGGELSAKNAGTA